MKTFGGQLAILALTACSGTEGTISVTLTTAPGDPVLDAVQSLSFTLTNPTTTTVAERTGDGFDLALDISTEGTGRAIIIEGRDAAGTTIAVGQSPVFPITAITARVVVFMARPMSFATSPVQLGVARSGIGTAALSYGAILVGGLDGAGAATDQVGVYNAFDHSLLAGMPMPDPHAHPCVVAGSANNDVLIFGGDGTGELLRFSTSTPPSGAFVELADHPEWARACDGSNPARANLDHFVIPGTPVIEIGGNAIAAREMPDHLDAEGASVTTSDGIPTAIFAGTAGYTRFRNDVVDTAPGAFASIPRVAANPADLSIVVVDETSIRRIDPITFAIGAPVALSTPRQHPAVAATTRHVIVASDATADIFDASTLAYLTTIPLATPRTHPTAVAMANDQILVVNGAETVELFTPPAPPLDRE